MQLLPPNLRPKLSPRARLQTDKITGKPILLYPEGILVLNKTGHAIVALCDGNSTIEKITALLAGQFQAATPEQMNHDVRDYLSALRARNLLDLLEDSQNPA
jgi:pyrroloquinoline quinone biosynthesis protein D